MWTNVERTFKRLKINMKIHKNCPHCGASMQTFTHTLSAGIVKALIKAVEFVGKNNKNEFHLQRDLTNLTKNEYANFQKLRLHGLAAKVEDKPGYWLITRRGGAFLRGELGIPHFVQTFRNKIISHSGDIVSIANFRGKIPEFQKDFFHGFADAEDLSKVTLF